MLRFQKQVEPYRKGGNDLPESLFIGRVRRFFVGGLGTNLGSVLAVLWGALAFLGLVPLMLCAYVLGDFFEHKWFAWPAIIFLVTAYPWLVYRWLGPIPCGLVVAAILFILMDIGLRRN